MFAAPARAQVDPHATRETRHLFAAMRALADRGVMFGHQNTLEYGHNWRDESNRSDVKDVVGDFPAVYGLDIGDLFRRSRPDEFDPAGAARLRRFVLEAQGRGGVVTFSWHMPNPVTGTDAWDTTSAVAAIIPGGRLHAAYTARLDRVAAFFRSLTDARGRPIPVWFRPFHEQTGNWFWWGEGHASPAEFTTLWRFTADHLRGRGVHNLLYAFSTDVFDDERAYFRFYPGDAYVDLLGFDDYHSIESPATRPVFVRRLGDVVRWARARGKLAALTETGLEALPDPHWWTGTLLPGLAASPGISYALVWRNATAAVEHREHFFAPYPGQASATDFKLFYRDPLTLFERDLPDLYGHGVRPSPVVGSGAIVPSARKRGRSSSGSR